MVIALVAGIVIAVVTAVLAMRAGAAEASKQARRAIDEARALGRRPDAGGEGDLVEQEAGGEGIDHEVGRKIVKQLKESGLKVQAQIQGDKVRITGKKRDDLQEAMALLRKAGFMLVDIEPVFHHPGTGELLQVDGTFFRP